MKVSEVMQTEVKTIPADADIKAIAKILWENKISGAPVVDQNGKMIGVVSEGDLLHKETNPRVPDAIGILGAIIFYNGVKQYDNDFKKLIATNARQIMTKDVITISQEATIGEAATIMVNKKINRLPVVEAGKLVGIVTRIDIIKTLIDY